MTANGLRYVCGIIGKRQIIGWSLHDVCTVLLTAPHHLNHGEGCDSKWFMLCVWDYWEEADHWLVIA